jgi:hypothetical protein
VSIRGFIKGTDTFPIQKCAIFRKFKEISGIARRHTFVRRSSDSARPCHVFSVIDAEIAEKGHLWTETSEMSYQSLPSGLDVEFFENVVNHLYSPVALRPSGVRDAAATHPLPGAHQQLAGHRSFLKFNREIKGLAIAMGRLYIG